MTIPTLGDLILSYESAREVPDLEDLHAWDQGVTGMRNAMIEQGIDLDDPKVCAAILRLLSMTEHQASSPILAGATADQIMFHREHGCGTDIRLQTLALGMVALVGGMMAAVVERAKTLCDLDD